MSSMGMPRCEHAACSSETESASTPSLAMSYAPDPTARRPGRRSCRQDPRAAPVPRR